MLLHNNKQAQEGIEGLVGTQAPAFEEARGLVRSTNTTSNC